VTLKRQTLGEQIGEAKAAQVYLIRDGEVTERTYGLITARNTATGEYLQYFINGPDLPKETVRGFCKIIDNDAGTSGMVLDKSKAFVRKEVRDKGLNLSHAPDEFFKLAHEIGRPSLADSVRSAAKSVRK
jgi:hypothetical protein